VVHRFKRHPCGDSAIANHTYGTTFFAFFLGGNGNTDTCADGG
jgi:hypothetical protein